MLKLVLMSMQVCSHSNSMLLEGKLLVGIGWGGNLLSMNSLRELAEFINLLHAALQLTIKEGENRTMQQYQGLNNNVFQLKTIIDKWVQEYIVPKTAPARFCLCVPHSTGSDSTLEVIHSLLL